MYRVLTVLGTRPEIIKLSPLIPLLTERFAHVLVHSGQHYDPALDASFFSELALPQPDHHLAVGSGAHGEQTARMLQGLEPLLRAYRPDAVLVQGDTNTTLAGGLTAAKLGIPVVHLEAGCRSFNRAMPEEINRRVVDHLSALLLAPDAAAAAHLAAEGLHEPQVQVIGSSAIDAVEHNRRRAMASPVLTQLGLSSGEYLMLTLHRAENTTSDRLPGLLAALGELATEQPVIFPVHPRTAAAIKSQGLRIPEQIRAIAPLGYLDTLRLVHAARALLTDSGGLQEEAAVLGTPTLILRNETEWQYLVDAGLHTLVGNSGPTLLPAIRAALAPASLARVRSTPAPVETGASLRACDALERLLAEKD